MKEECPLTEFCENYHRRRCSECALFTLFRPNWKWKELMKGGADPLAFLLAG